MLNETESPGDNEQGTRNKGQETRNKKQGMSNSVQVIIQYSLFLVRYFSLSQNNKKVEIAESKVPPSGG